MSPVALILYKITTFNVAPKLVPLQLGLWIVEPINITL